MSSGPSLLREKPLSAESICMEEQPASRRAASTPPGPNPNFGSRSFSSLNLPSTGFTWPLNKREKQN